MSSAGELAERVRDSPWAAGVPGLARAVARWEHEVGRARPWAGSDRGRLAWPGMVSPQQVARRWAAFGATQLEWLARQLPADLLSGRPLDDPADWAQQATAQMTRDQLARLGPVAAEVAGVLADAGRLLPDPLADELRRRPVTSPALPTATVERTARRALPGRLGEIAGPVAVGAVSQLHPAVLRDGSPVLLRVCRSDVAPAVRSDARLAASVLLPLELAVPLVGALNPLALVELVSHQLLEGADARNEALNAVELGLLVEDLGIQGIVIPRPLPDLVTASAAAFEPIEEAVVLPRTRLPPEEEGASGAGAPPALATGALVRLTVEAALARGPFHGDVVPNGFAVLADGRLAAIGCRSVGHLDLATRRGILDAVAGALMADGTVVVAGLDEMGALPATLDRDALAAELSTISPADPFSLLSRGGAGVIAVAGDLAQVLFRHRLRLPLEVILLVRGLLGVRATAEVLDPSGGALLPAALPLVTALPKLRSALA